MIKEPTVQNKHSSEMNKELCLHANSVLRVSFGRPHPPPTGAAVSRETHDLAVKLLVKACGVWRAGEAREQDGIGCQTLQSKDGMFASSKTSQTLKAALHPGRRWGGGVT